MCVCVGGACVVQDLAMERREGGGVQKIERDRERDVDRE